MENRYISDIEQLFISFKYQLLFYFKTYRFIGLALFVIAISMISLVIEINSGISSIQAQYSTASAYLESYLGNIIFAIGVTAALFGGDAISTDFSTNTSYFMLTQPIKRNILFMGRLIAALAASFAIVLFYYIIAMAGSLYFYSTLPVTVIYSLLLAFLLMAAMLALAFLFSALFRRPMVGMLVTLLIIWLAFPAVTGILSSLENVEPWFAINYGGEVVYQIFGSNIEHHFTTIVRTGIGRNNSTAISHMTLYGYNPYLWEGIVIMVAYLVICTVLAMILYNYKEVKG